MKRVLLLFILLSSIFYSDNVFNIRGDYEYDFIDSFISSSKNATTIDMQFYPTGQNIYLLKVQLFQISLRGSAHGSLYEALTPEEFLNRDFISDNVEINFFYEKPSSPLDKILNYNCKTEKSICEVSIDLTSIDQNYFNNDCIPIYAKFKGNNDYESSRTPSITLCKEKNLHVGKAFEEVVNKLDTGESYVCISFFIFLGFLISSLYVSGGNPLKFFDITTPRLPSSKFKIKYNVSNEKSFVQKGRQNVAAINSSIKKIYQKLNVETNKKYFKFFLDNLTKAFPNMSDKEKYLMAKKRTDNKMKEIEEGVNVINKIYDDIVKKIKDNKKLSARDAIVAEEKERTIQIGTLKKYFNEQIKIIDKTPYEGKSSSSSKTESQTSDLNTKYDEYIKQRTSSIQAQADTNYLSTFYRSAASNKGGIGKTRKFIERIPIVSEISQRLGFKLTDPSFEIKAPIVLGKVIIEGLKREKAYKEEKKFTERIYRESNKDNFYYQFEVAKDESNNRLDKLQVKLQDIQSYTKDKMKGLLFEMEVSEIISVLNKVSKDDSKLSVSFKENLINSLQSIKTTSILSKEELDKIDIVINTLSKPNLKKIELRELDENLKTFEFSEEQKKEILNYQKELISTVLENSTMYDQLKNEYLNDILIKEINESDSVSRGKFTELLGKLKEEISFDDEKKNVDKLLKSTSGNLTSQKLENLLGDFERVIKNAEIDISTKKQFLNSYQELVSDVIYTEKLKEISKKDNPISDIINSNYLNYSEIYSNSKRNADKTFYATINEGLEEYVDLGNSENILMYQQLIQKEISSNSNNKIKTKRDNLIDFLIKDLNYNPNDKLILGIKDISNSKNLKKLFESLNKIELSSEKKKQLLLIYNEFTSSILYNEKLLEENKIFSAYHVSEFQRPDTTGNNIFTKEAFESQLAALNNIPNLVLRKAIVEHFKNNETELLKFDKNEYNHLVTDYTSKDRYNYLKEYAVKYLPKGNEKILLADTLHSEIKNLNFEESSDMYLNGVLEINSFVDSLKEKYNLIELGVMDYLQDPKEKIRFYIESYDAFDFFDQGSKKNLSTLIKTEGFESAVSLISRKIKTADDIKEIFNLDLPRSERALEITQNNVKTYLKYFAFSEIFEDSTNVFNFSSLNSPEQKNNLNKLKEFFANNMTEIYEVSYRKGILSVDISELNQEHEFNFRVMADDMFKVISNGLKSSSLTDSEIGNVVTFLRENFDNLQFKMDEIKKRGIKNRKFEDLCNDKFVKDSELRRVQAIFKRAGFEEDIFKLRDYSEHMLARSDNLMFVANEINNPKRDRILLLNKGVGTLVEDTSNLTGQQILSEINTTVSKVLGGSFERYFREGYEKPRLDRIKRELHTLYLEDKLERVGIIYDYPGSIEDKIFGTPKIISDIRESNYDLVRENLVPIEYKDIYSGKNKPTEEYNKFKKEFDIKYTDENLTEIKNYLNQDISPHIIYDLIEGKFDKIRTNLGLSSEIYTDFMMEKLKNDVYNLPDKDVYRRLYLRGWESVESSYLQEFKKVIPDANIYDLYDLMDNKIDTLSNNLSLKSSLKMPEKENLERLRKQFVGSDENTYDVMKSNGVKFLMGGNNPKSVQEIYYIKKLYDKSPLMYGEEKEKKIKYIIKEELLKNNLDANDIVVNNILNFYGHCLNNGLLLPGLELPSEAERLFGWELDVESNYNVLYQHGNRERAFKVLFLTFENVLEDKSEIINHMDFSLEQNRKYITNVLKEKLGEYKDLNHIEIQNKLGEKYNPILVKNIQNYNEYISRFEKTNDYVPAYKTTSDTGKVVNVLAPKTMNINGVNRRIIFADEGSQELKKFGYVIDNIFNKYFVTFEMIGLMSETVSRFNAEYRNKDYISKSLSNYLSYHTTGFNDMVRNVEVSDLLSSLFMLKWSFLKRSELNEENLDIFAHIKEKKIKGVLDKTLSNMQIEFVEYFGLNQNIKDNEGNFDVEQAFISKKELLSLKMDSSDYKTSFLAKTEHDLLIKKHDEYSNFEKIISSVKRDLNSNLNDLSNALKSNNTQKAKDLFDKIINPLIPFAGEYQLKNLVENKMNKAGYHKQYCKEQIMDYKTDLLLLNFQTKSILSKFNSRFKKSFEYSSELKKFFNVFMSDDVKVITSQMIYHDNSVVNYLTDLSVHYNVKFKNISKAKEHLEKIINDKTKTSSEVTFATNALNQLKDNETTSKELNSELNKILIKSSSDSDDPNFFSEFTKNKSLEDVLFIRENLDSLEFLMKDRKSHLNKIKELKENKAYYAHLTKIKSFKLDNSKVKFKRQFRFNLRNTHESYYDDWNSLVNNHYEKARKIHKVDDDFDKLFATTSVLFENLINTYESIYKTRDIGAHTRRSAFGLASNEYGGTQFSGPISSTPLQYTGPLAMTGNQGVFSSFLTPVIFKHVHRHYRKNFAFNYMISDVPKVYSIMGKNSSMSVSQYFNIKSRMSLNRFGELLNPMPFEKPPDVPDLILSLWSRNIRGERRISEMWDFITGNYRGTPQGFRDVFNYVAYKPNDVITDFKDKIFTYKESRSMKKTAEHLFNIGIYAPFSHNKFIAGREITLFNDIYHTMSSDSTFYPNRAMNLISSAPHFANPKYRNMAYHNIYQLNQSQTEMVDNVFALSHMKYKTNWNPLSITLLPLMIGTSTLGFGLSAFGMGLTSGVFGAVASKIEISPHLNLFKFKNDPYKKYEHYYKKGIYSNMYLNDENENK